MSMKGLMIATLAGGMFSAMGAAAFAEEPMKPAKVHCAGTNECQGKGAASRPTTPARATRAARARAYRDNRGRVQGQGRDHRRRKDLAVNSLAARAGPSSLAPRQPLRLAFVAAPRPRAPDFANSIVIGRGSSAGRVSLHELPPGPSSFSLESACPLSPCSATESACARRTTYTSSRPGRTSTGSR